MSVKEYLKQVKMIYGITFAWIAKAIGQAPQSLSNKLSRETLKASELFQIAEAIDAEVHFVDHKTGKIII